MTKALFIALSLLHIFLLQGAVWAQEEKEAPSQKTKEAIEKFKKGPAALGKGLQALREAGRARLQETLGAKGATKAGGETLALPTKKSEEPERPRYSPTGRRDPFRPLTVKAKVATKAKRDPATLSPLERYELGQLKLVGIVWDIKEPTAMVEDATGLGYIVKVGTPIGPNEGKIKAIKPTEIVIEESYIDFLGARKSEERSIRLPQD